MEAIICCWLQVTKIGFARPTVAEACNQEGPAFRQICKKKKTILKKRKERVGHFYFYFLGLVKRFRINLLQE